MPARYLNQLIHYCGLLSLALLLSTCDVVNPSEEIPSYLYIEAPRLNTDPAQQGSDSENITEVWVSINDRFIGAYRLPIRVPVLAQGETQVRIEAGIRENGISSSPDIYPFYTSFERTVDLQPLEVDTLRPSIQYQEEVKFGFIETFENDQQIFNQVFTGSADRGIKLSTDVVFEGNSSGLLELDTANALLEIGAMRRFDDLLDNGLSVYLEVNYRSEVPASFGVLGFPANSDAPDFVAYEAGFLPSDEWQKIYLNLTPVVLEGNRDTYQILLRTFIPTNDDGTFSRNTAKVWIDNVKLLYF